MAARDAIGRGVARGLRRLAREERGGLVVFAMFVLVIMLAAGGLAVDTIRHERERARLQTTLDRAVLAASNLDQALEPREVVESYVAAAGVTEALGTVTPDVGLNYKEVCAEAGRGLSTVLLHLAGVEALRAEAAACAAQHVTEVEISLVLDMSGSMDDNQRLPRLKVAATEFVETMLDDDLPGRRTTISLVPFTSQVNAGAEMLGELHVTDEHEYTHCVSFDAADFRETAISHGAADPLRRTSNFAPSVEKKHPDPRDRYCPSGDATEILPWSDDAAALKDHIADLIAAGGTSIDVGAKWGVALLDPSMNGVLNHYADEGAVDDTYRNRPAAHGGEDVIKVMVLLSDGENVLEYRLTADYREGPSGIWVDPKDNRADETNYGNDRYSSHRDRSDPEDYYRHHDDEWHHAPDGGDDAHEMDWPEVFQRLSVHHLMGTIMRKAYAGNYPSGALVPTGFPYPIHQISAATKDARSSHICQAARGAGVIVYTIGFETPAKGEAVLRGCATSEEQHHFDVEGVEISEAFRTIADAIQDLRLTR